MCSRVRTPPCNAYAVAAEIYARLLADPAVPRREREVALRKLAECNAVEADATEH
tara:strand:- start:168 stop:332 length:165 start_codon:yes stop_codon:yes gene_type:complete